MTDMQIHTVNEMIAYLAPTLHISQIARRLGVTHSMVKDRMASMGIVALDFAESLSPTEGEWIGCAMSASIKTGVSHKDILNRHNQTAAVVNARWLAYRICLDTHPQYSVAGLSRTIGISHASILHGLDRLSGVPAKPKGINRSRASGRKPEYLVECQQSREAA